MTVQAPVRRRTRDNFEPPKAVTPVIETVDVATCIASLQTQLDRLQSQVRQAQQLAALGVSAATMAHEFRGLLTPVRSYLQYALRDNDPALTKKAMTVALQHTDILTRMAERVLGATAQSPLEPKTINVLETVEQAVETLCRKLEKDSITLKLDIDPTLTVWADALSLQQVLFNLLVNAQRAMAKQHGGRLKIIAVREGNRVQIHVRDTGGGIDPEIMSELFNPLTSTKSFGNGEPRRCSGLGLALCKDLVEENGGLIDVESEVGTGTCFTITLPHEQPESPAQGK